MTFGAYLLLVAGMGVVTYVPRWLPLLTLSRRRLPQWLIDWLGLIPVALLSALVAPALLADATTRTLQLGQPELLAAVPTFLFALKTRSLGGTVLVGMLHYWLVRQAGI
jgi:branched-subunit amino acid transport protein